MRGQRRLPRSLQPSGLVGLLEDTPTSGNFYSELLSCLQLNMQVHYSSEWSIVQPNPKEEGQIGPPGSTSVDSGPEWTPAVDLLMGDTIEQWC